MEQHETTEQTPALRNDSGLSAKSFGYSNRWKFISTLIRKQIGQCRIVYSGSYSRADTNADNYIELKRTRGYVSKSGLIRLNTNEKLSGIEEYELFATVCKLLSTNNIAHDWEQTTSKSITVWEYSFNRINSKSSDRNDYDCRFGVGVSPDGMMNYYVDANDHSKGFKALLVDPVRIPRVAPNNPNFWDFRSD